MIRRRHLNPVALGVGVLAAMLLGTSLLGACSDGSTNASDPAPTTTSTAGRRDDVPDEVVDDAYFPGTGTTALDVVAYDVDAEVTVEGTDRLDAVATLTIEAVEALTSFELDLTGMDVTEVTVDGDAATATTAGDKLVVTPAAAIDRGTTFETTITYGGEPAGRTDQLTTLEEGGGGWLDLGAYSAVVAEPIGASTWLPGNDLPSDKATFAIDVTVPSPLAAVSNGLLLGTESDATDGTTTYRWRAEEPMAPYLMTLVVGDLELIGSTLPDGTAVIDAVPPDTDAAVRSPLARFPDMVAFLEGRLGDYPFSAAGNIVVPGMPPTALETQTRSVLSLAALRQDPDQLVVHELTHQWFGDSVTPLTWADIWLNEGPAVYFQWSWAEKAGGPTLEESARISWDAADDSMDVPPGDPGEDEMFGRSVYERSAMFLIELEHLMGTESFDQLLQTWLTEHAGGNATTEEFVELAGEIHGAPITGLSDPWLYGDELPDLSF